MASLFNNLVRFGIEDDTPAHRREEIKMMNSIALHSIAFTIFAGTVTVLMLPKHLHFILLVAITEIIAKTCVLLLHFVQKYTPAKIIFTLVTLSAFLMLVIYFGVSSNFHYLIIISFFTLVIIFKNGTPEDLLITGIYLVIGVGGTGIAYWFDKPLVSLSTEEMQVGKEIAFVTSVALAVMVSVIFFRASNRWGSASREGMAEIARTANILKTISQNVSEGIFKTHSTKGFVYVNQAFVKMFGYDLLDKVMLESAEHLFHIKAEHEEIMDEVRIRGNVNNRLVEFRKKDGKLFWGRLSCSLVVETGEEMIVGTVTDVSSQQEHESLLRESEDQLREAQKIAKIGNWQLFNASKILRWSEGCMAIHGFGPFQTDHDLRDWIDRLDDMDESQIDTLMARAMMANEEVRFSSWYTTPDGERKFLVYITRYHRSDSVRGGIWYGIVQDFTEQKLAEMRLLETKKFYESWVDQLPVKSITAALGLVTQAKKSQQSDELDRASALLKESLDTLAQQAKGIGGKAAP